MNKPMHPEDAMVDRLAEAMKAKLAQSREKGRGGWDDPQDCPIARLYRMMIAHAHKGNLDMVDVATFAGMIWHRVEHVPGDRDELSSAIFQAGRSFQSRTDDWMQACFGPEISQDGQERNHRFLEEALELVQSLNCTQSEAHQLVDYVFARPVGEPKQELGGVMVTLAALANVHHMDMAEDGETELARVWTKVEQIRAKQAAKPKHSPLPGAL